LDAEMMGSKKFLSVLYDGVKYFRWRGNRFVPSQWALRSQEQHFFLGGGITRSPGLFLKSSFPLALDNPIPSPTYHSCECPNYLQLPM